MLVASKLRGGESKQLGSIGSCTKRGCELFSLILLPWELPQPYPQSEAHNLLAAKEGLEDLGRIWKNVSRSRRLFYHHIKMNFSCKF